MKASFRVTGKMPRLWHPETGETEPVSYTIEKGQTIVPLHFDAQGSVFVVFEGSARRLREWFRPNAGETGYRGWRLGS